MGNIKKIGDSYYVEFEARGLKYQQKAGHDEQTAKQLLEDIEEKIRRGEIAATVRDVDIQLFFTDFLDFIKEYHTLKTYDRFAQLVIHFTKFLSNYFSQAKQLSHLTPKVIEGYKVYLKNKEKPRVVNLSLILLHNLFDYALKTEYLNDNPVLHIKFVPLPYAAPLRCLSEAEICAVFRENKPTLSLWSTILDASKQTPKLNVAIYRNTFVSELLKQNLSLARIYQLIGFRDIAKMIRYTSLVQSLV